MLGRNLKKISRREIVSSAMSRANGTGEGTKYNLSKIRPDKWRNIPIPLVNAIETLVGEAMKVSMRNNNHMTQLNSIERKMMEN